MGEVTSRTEESSPVLVTVSDGICRVTLNRESRRNALNGEVIEILIDTFDAARGDERVRVCVLTGAGDRAFCSGADLDPTAASRGPIALHQERRRFAELLRSMREAGVPIVARVAGPVRAGGLGLMLGCDLVVAADDVTFGTPEIRVGLFPMMIMALIVRNIPRKIAMELLMTGEPIDAGVAADIGMINRAVPRDELDDAVDELAGKLASFSPIVMQLGRDAFYTMEGMPLDGAIEYLCDQLTVNTLAEDAAEGIMAFIGKREPEWKGR